MLSPEVPRLRLIQLPVPPPAALAATGNVPLAAGSLAVAAEVHGLTARGLETEVVAPELTDSLGDTLLADYASRDEPDFIGLSLYLWNVERSLHLAREIQARSPNTKILVGGPEITPGQGFVLKEHGYDIAVMGEAEDRFAALMECLMEGRDPSAIRGVAVRQADGRMSPFGVEPVPEFALKTYPSPYVTGAIPVDPARSTYVETVRGCASKCAYCFYPRSSSNLRTLDIEATRSLLATLHERGAREVVFLDPTFNHRTGIDDVLAALADANPDRRMSFFAEVRPEGLTAAHARAMAKAGFTKLEIGLQSVNIETLRRVQRFGNPDKVAEAAKMLCGEGIDLFIDLIIGLPGDTPDDVARGIDFLLDHDLAGFAQVFPLSVLPGTAMRNRSDSFGLTFDSAPPYLVQRTETFTEDQLIESLFAAEDALDRRLNETPRLHLVDDGGNDLGARDVFEFDLDATCDSGTPFDEPGARHAAVWFLGSDLFARRDTIRNVIAKRLELDPHSVLDVLLRPTARFPLDLLDGIRNQLDAALPSYQSRALAHRGENLQRRIGVVLEAGADFPREWIDAALDSVPVFRDQSSRDAMAAAPDLGDREPGARVLDAECDDAAWQALTDDADPEAVTFASRELEQRWQGQRIGYD